LALDWCRGTPLDRLAGAAFALHAELADELGNPWFYRVSRPYGGMPSRTTRTWPEQRPWLSGRVAITGQLGSPQTTALASRAPSPWA